MEGATFLFDALAGWEDDDAEGGFTQLSPLSADDRRKHELQERDEACLAALGDASPAL